MSAAHAPSGVRAPKGSDELNPLRPSVMNWLYPPAEAAAGPAEERDDEDAPADGRPLYTFDAATKRIG